MVSVRWPRHADRPSALRSGSGPLGRSATRVQRDRASARHATDGCAAHTADMLKTALRFLLLRFLPRRLFPILTVFDAIRFIRRLRRGRPQPVAPRRIVTSARPAPAVPPAPPTRGAPHP